MRNVIKLSVLAILALCLSFGQARVAHADDRADARAHYQAGQKLYSGGDYRGAIKEFSAAQQLVPADLNNYNLALCYDKLGEAEPAIQYYRAYLDRVPSTEKRAEIEASVQRLDAALKSAGAKKVDEDRKAEEARKAAAAEEARKGEEARKYQEEQDRKRAEEESRQAPPAGGTGVGVGVGGAVGGVTGGIGTPGTGAPQPTGDAQLDRIQGVDINAMRDERGMSSGGRAGAGAGVTAGAGAGAPPTTQPGQITANGQIGANGQIQTAPGPNGVAGPMANNPNGQPLQGDKPATVEPVYKKWWFWVVVGVSAYVVYEIANDNSTSATNGRTGRESPHVVGGKSIAEPGGFTLLRW